MLSQLVGKLMPHLSVIIYAEIMLLCLAILVGCFFILKKVISRPNFEGDPAYDYERIANEIEQEIARLENLRLRLGGKKGKVDLENLGSDPAMNAAKTMSTAELDALVEERYKSQFDELKSELQKSAKEMTSPGDGEIKRLQTENELHLTEIKRLQEEIKRLQEAGSSVAIASDESGLKEKVTHLEKIISEYQVFEEDFALVKKYKAEAEQLKIQLESNASSVPAAPVTQQNVQAVTEADIATMFNELSAPAPEAAALPTSIPASPAPASEAKGPEAEGVTPDPGVEQSTPENQEALAESAATDDRLVAEFEKLLGGENKG